MNQLIIDNRLAFELSDAERVSSLGLKVLRRMSSDLVAIPDIVTHNGDVRLLYARNGFSLLHYNSLSLEPCEVQSLLAALSNSLHLCVETPFLEIEFIRPSSPFFVSQESPRRFVFPVCPIHPCDTALWLAELKSFLNNIASSSQADCPDDISDCLRCDSAEELINYLLSHYRDDESIQPNNSSAHCELVMRYNGEYGAQSFFVTPSAPIFVIGSDPSVTGFLSGNPAVSRQHCQIVQRDGHFFLKDLESTNHTLLNGRLLAPEDELIIRDGDRVQIADMDFIVNIST